MKYQQSDFTLRASAAVNFATEMLELGYEHGIEAVEYLSLRSAKIFEYETIRDDITINFLQKLLSKNSTKTLRHLADNTAMINVYYGLSSNPFAGTTLTVLINALSANKLAVAEKLLKAAFKNPYANLGAGMVAMFDGYINALAAKQGVKVPAVGKKPAELLSLYAEKIKGAEGPLLLQRIKELT